MDKPTSLLDHLSQKSTPDTVWEEYLTLQPARQSDWLKGDPCRFEKMLQADAVSQRLAELLTDQLGVKIWHHQQQGKSILTNLFENRLKVQTSNTSTLPLRKNSGAVAAAAKRLPPGALLLAVEQAKADVPLNRQLVLNLSVAVPQQDPLKEAYSLLELGFGKAALVCGIQNPSLHKRDSQGKNLAWLLATTAQGQRAWIDSGMPLNADVWIDTQGQQLDKPLPWAAWLNKAGFFHDETKSWMRKHQNEGDPLLEEQLRGKHWRGAIGRRENWREWTSGRGANALHILAQHHPASFLTSQARVQANHTLLGQQDDQGHDIMSYLLLGMAIQAPEQGNRSYWANALGQFREVARKVEQERTEQGIEEPKSGVLRLILDQQSPPPAIYSKNFLNFGQEAKGWMARYPQRVWAGMDQNAGFSLLRNPKLYALMEPLWALAIRQAADHGFPDNVPRETQMAVMALALGQSNAWTWSNERVTQILEGPLDIPPDIVERIEQHMEKHQGHTQDMIKSRLKRLHLDTLISGRQGENETVPVARQKL